MTDRDGGNESVDDSDCGNVAQENDDDNDEDDANDRNFRVGSFGSGYMIQQQSEHSTSNEPMNPFPEWIRSFVEVLGSLSKDVFERRTSTGSEAFFLFICLDANKFVLLTFFSLTKTSYPRVSTKPLPNDAKSPYPVDVRRSKTLLLTRRTSTGSEAFSLFICLNSNKFVLLSFFSLIETIYTRVSTKLLANDAKSPLPVDVRRSKTLLLKVPII